MTVELRLIAKENYPPKDLLVFPVDPKIAEYDLPPRSVVLISEYQTLRDKIYDVVRDQSTTDRIMNIVYNKE